MITEMRVELDHKMECWLGVCYCLNAEYTVV